MTKADIIKEVAKATGIEQAAVGEVVEGFMEQVRSSLGRKNDVFLRGFGTFKIVRRAAKTARNITKNTTVIVPEHDHPVFKPSPEFSQKIR